jgi:hypothetical protein
MAGTRLTYGIVHRKKTFIIKLDMWSDRFLCSGPGVFLFSSALNIGPLSFLHFLLPFM